MPDLSAAPQCQLLQFPHVSKIQNYIMPINMTTVYLPLNIGTESSDAVMLGMIRFMWV